MKILKIRYYVYVLSITAALAYSIISPCLRLCQVNFAYLPVPFVLVVFDVNVERAAFFPVTPTLCHARRQTSLSRLGVCHLTAMVPACATFQLRLVSFHQQVDASTEAVEAAGDGDRERPRDVARHARLDAETATEADVLGDRNVLAERVRKHIHVRPQQWHARVDVTINETQGRDFLNWRVQFGQSRH